MPICPKCHKLISEGHLERHMRRCGTTHRHEPQSLYVPSATAQIESPNRGITYGPPSSPRGRRRTWGGWKLVVVVILLAAVVLAAGAFLRLGL